MVKTFLLSLAPTRNGVYRTCLLTPSATDTFRTVGVFHRVDHHLASLCTFSTVNAFFCIYSIAKNRNFVKYRIKSAQRTDIFTEWPVNNNREYDRNHKNRIFPYKKPSYRTAHGFIQKHQWKSSFQRTCRADQLTEIWCTLSHDIYNKHRKQDYKYHKDHVF